MLIVFLFDIKDTGFDHAIGECVRGFDVTIYQKIFGDTHNVWNATDAQIDMGLPGIRARMITSIVEEKWAPRFLPGSDEYKKFFYRKVVVDACAYFREEPAQVEAFAQGLMVEKYGGLLPFAEPPFPWEEFLTPDQKWRLSAYRCICRG